MQSDWICPSILAANFAALGAEVDAVLAAGADSIHFDVMDNHYVPNLTIGPMVLSALRAHGVTQPIDVHLMVKPVDALIEAFVDAGADLITIHPETTEHLHRSLQIIRSAGKAAGVVLNPATPLAVLEPVLGLCDLVLLMSVNPGFGGQTFIDETLPRLQAVRSMIDAQPRPIRLQVDGGVKVDNIGAIARAGADTFVAGSAIFGQSDYASVIRAMRAQIDAARR